MHEPDAQVLHRILDERGGFSHREHLELVWSYLQIHDLEGTRRAVASAIRQLAGAHGAPNKYHETITRCWVHLVAVHAARSEAESFDQFVAENSALLDRRLLERHYSPGLISSDQAREDWVKPDLRSLPGREPV